jgi:hypothetical protein
LLSSQNSSDIRRRIILRAGFCFLGLSPILAYRYREVNRVTGSRKFKLSSIFLYTSCITGIIYLSYRLVR